MLAALVLSACAGDSDGTGPCTAASVTVSPLSASLTVGETRQLQAQVNATCSGAPAATWTSSASAVATVSPGGLVTAVAPGTASITAASGSASGSASITVSPPAIASLVFDPATLTLSVGESATLNAVARDAQGNVLTGRTLAWTTSTPSLVTVTQTGQVTAQAPGTASVSAAAEGRVAVAEITVLPVVAPVASITLEADSTLLAHGESGMIRATFRDAQGNVLSDREAVFIDESAGYLSLPPASDWVFCANEGGVCAFDGQKTVRYGANDTWIYRTATGSLDCANGSFVQDPVPGVVKQCFVATPTTTTGGSVLATAAYCHFDNCQRGISQGVIRVTPVENPLGVSATLVQEVVPAFVITTRTPDSEGPLSIETTNTVTFSNNVQGPPYGGFQFGLRDTQTDAFIDPEPGWSVTENVITYPVLLEENREYRFTVTEELLDQFGKRLRNPGAFTYTTVQMDKLYYYRLTSQFSDPLGRSLAINPANRTCLMAPTDTGDPQQQWFVEPYDESAPGLDTRLSPGTRVRLRNQAYGSARNLEAAAPGGPCQMNPASATVFSGESWYSAFRFDQVGFFWLHVGDATYALDQPGGGTIAGLAETGAFSGQAWFITRLGRR